mmetsp:Transcript_38917/g.70119  ORF Transcript_38917/g.70119 Transcript_38917/m.70119 type:complete len:260 (-) Transcript_38917:565-1344(-)
MHWPLLPSKLNRNRSPLRTGRGRSVGPMQTGSGVVTKVVECVVVVVLLEIGVEVVDEVAASSNNVNDGGVGSTFEQGRHWMISSPVQASLTTQVDVTFLQNCCCCCCCIPPPPSLLVLSCWTINNLVSVGHTKEEGDGDGTMVGRPLVEGEDVGALDVGALVSLVSSLITTASIVDLLPPLFSSSDFLPPKTIPRMAAVSMTRRRSRRSSHFRLLFEYCCSCSSTDDGFSISSTGCCSSNGMGTAGSDAGSSTGVCFST